MAIVARENKKVAKAKQDKLDKKQVKEDARVAKAVKDAL